MRPTCWGATAPPRLSRELQRQINRLAARRARAEIDAVWRRHQLELQASAIDMLIAGRAERDVLGELRDGNEN